MSLKGLQFFEDRVNLSVFSPLLCPQSPSALCELHRKRPSEKLVHTEGGRSPWESRRAVSYPAVDRSDLRRSPVALVTLYLQTGAPCLCPHPDPSLSRPALAPSPLTIGSKGDSGKEAEKGGCTVSRLRSSSCIFL